MLIKSVDARKNELIFGKTNVDNILQRFMIYYYLVFCCYVVCKQ
jgi:preprotein translocase subunit SecG